MSTSQNKERKISPIQRFFIICSGADKGIIEQYPTEWNKYTGIGATIFFTGLLAWLSGGYALYTVFRVEQLDEAGNIIDVIDKSALWFAVPFGFLWGAVIFNLDRFIVSTFHKSNETGFWKRFGIEFSQALPRILLAVIIAITISKPIEIKIFESRLGEQILRNEIAAKKSNIDDFSSIHGLSAKEKRVANLDTVITNLQTELTTDPQNVKDLINNDLVQANSTLTRIRNLNNPKINTHRQHITAIRNNTSNYRPVLDTLGRVIDNRLTQEANEKIRNENKAINTLNGEISTQQAKVNNIEQQIANARNEHRTQKQQEISDRKQEKDTAKEQLKTSTATAEKEAEDANAISEKSFASNFITQLEALGDLTKITDKDDEITRNKKRTMWWISLVITLLFLTIELAPILTKLISKRGAYDETLERTEYENMIVQKEIISRKNSEINELLRRAEEAARLSGEVMIQKQKDKLYAELTNNKIILDKIAGYQQELALLAIEKWREEELSKINSGNTNIRTTQNT